MLLPNCRFDLVYLKLNKVCHRNDHLGDDGLAVEHLEEIRKIAEWTWLRIEGPKIEVDVTLDA